MEQSASKAQSKAYATACGFALAYELKMLDVDFSFAPVLDINGVSQVIGDRAFSESAAEVAELASALISGLRRVNMPAIGKHFPGHGSVAPDSHIALPVDERAFSDIKKTDMVAFEQLIGQSLLDGVMPAHVIYQQVCSQPAGFSEYWLKQILRKTMGFKGAVFSDDLSMHGASVAGTYIDRATLALDAGCDMVLACNNVKGAESILDGLESRVALKSELDNQKQARIMALCGRRMNLGLQQPYKEAVALIQRLNVSQ